jgi:DNA gyrase subunit A
MNDNIIQIDSRKTYMENMARYSLYILYERYTPDIRDGLKPGQRRILYAMWNDVECTSITTKRKSANTVGLVIAKYHPHSNDAVYGSMKALTNWFEIKIPLINYDSNSGSLQGGSQAAMRYTESYLSKFTMECVIGELKEVRKVIDWQKTFDNHTNEPECLPVKVPLLLVNGCFGIAIGSRIESPKHSLNDVIDATINVLHDPKAKVVLIPDPCQKCEIVNTDWKKISNTGYGYYIERGIIDIEHNNKTGSDMLIIRSTPDMIFYDSVAMKIEELIKNKKLIQIADIQDHSTNAQLDIRIILKKGSDPNYVKQVLYKNTPLQDTKRVNMQVINDTDVSRISYKAYISYFLEFRRSVKFRLYNFRLQKAETRLHELDTYIKILESGDVENVIHMIRNQSSMDENYLIEWLMKKLKITDLQAKFVLHTEIGRLSKGHLNKYKEEQKVLLDNVNRFINIITNEKLIDQEIEAELLDIRARYGKPRQSILISESEASNIPEGEFKIVITEQNFIKKMQVNDPIKIIKGDNPKCIIIADNSKDILLFDQMGKVFRLPVHKLSFTDKNSPGLDIRLIIKKLTSNIVAVMYLPIIEHLQNKTSKHFIVTVTKGGLIKRIDIDDVVNATPSGIIYSKLNDGDMVCDVLIANQKSDVIVYTKSKALRMPIDQIPYLKRATLGNQAMKTKETIDGISVVTSDTKDVVVVTAKGRFNRLVQAAFERSDRNKAGSKVIKLTKGDYIKNIFPCSGNATIRVVRADEILEIETNQIPIGSSVSQGVKLCKDGVIKAEMIRK